MSSVLEAVGLTIPKRLHDVTLTFHPGEVTAICGPNGAGKSTLLSCLAGILRPKSGVVGMGGKVLLSMRPRERAQCIGYLPQSPEIAWNVTVEVLASLGRLPWGDEATAEGREARDSALSVMDLDGFRHRAVSSLSGGERARTLMARVLATRPAWLLADEPLANLDLGHALGLMRRMREQADQGKGVILVLHDLATAMNYAERVIVLDKGEVVADGEPRHALSGELISRVWQCAAQWVGEPGALALAVRR